VRAFIAFPSAWTLGACRSQPPGHLCAPSPSSAPCRRRQASSGPGRYRRASGSRG